MIIAKKQGDILAGGEKRIAFAVNTEGINDSGFAGVIARKFWPELAYVGETQLGQVLVHQANGIEFFALCCHSLKEGWKDQFDVIRNCFDAIPGDEPVATIKIGTGLVGILSGANFEQILGGMEVSSKEIILY